MKLKLRGNANALNRSACDAAKLLEQPLAAPEWDAEETIPGPVSPEPVFEPEPIPPTASLEQQNSLHWANAMKSEAARLQAIAAHVPPAQRKTNRLWVDVLNQVASDLTLGKVPAAPPGTTKSELFRSTLLAGGANFPAHLLKR